MDSMKNLFKGVVVVGLLFLSTGLVSAQQKIGHVNSNEIIQAMPEFKTANAEFENLSKSKEGELQQMGAEYQKKVTSAQELQRNRSEANRDSIDAKLQTLGVELQDIDRRIQEFQQVAQQELEQKREELFAPIFQKANTAVQAVAKEKGYAYVFDIAAAAIPYFAGGDDLTNDVKTKLGITSSTPAATPSNQ
ncbi:periplasmic chaperone for outer membrane proteins Skp [Parapedobacter luteus]|uniref:Periplasmic chaperone for outer membrane proteins Skp n=2 Tax=Sphingobacteriaceae TaxID=84566 RepID=A0A1T5BE21_9SPHI|nr:periplasmic chaperone for outer membrane proteins Skp [Parapedobacter luteus]